MAIHIRRRELLPADQIRKRERLAAVGDVDHVDTGHHLSGSTAFMFRPGWKTMRSACWSLSAPPRLAPFSAKPSAGPTLACNHQAPLRHRLSATTFAPITSSHRKLLLSKAMVVNVAEKPERDFGRYD